MVNLELFHDGVHTLVMSKEPINREKLMNFRTFVSTKSMRTHNHKREVKVLADNLTSTARRKLAESFKDVADVSFYRTERVIGTRFETFIYEPLIKIETLAKCLIPTPPMRVQKRLVTHRGPIALVESELHKKKECVTTTKGSFPVLEMIYKLQELHTVTADTDKVTLSEVYNVISSKNDPKIKFVDFISSVSKFQFRSTFDEFTLPYISSYKAGTEHHLHNEWEIVFRLFDNDDATAYTFILQAAIEDLLEKSASSYLRFIVTVICVRQVCKPSTVSTLR